MTRGLILFSALGLFWQNLFAAEVPKEVRDHIELLKGAAVFAIGPVGYAGMISAPEKALYQIMKQSDAKVILTKLLGDATIEGQMYALVGLRTLENAEFKSRLKVYTEMTSQVQTANGCMLSKEAVFKVVKAIASGQYELRPERAKQ